MNRLSKKYKPPKEQPTSERKALDQENRTCPVCGSSGWDVFFEMLNIPIFCNVLWSERQAAINCDRGNIRLSFCHHCGFIGNREFQPDLLHYTEAYENALDFSPRFQKYARTLALSLMDTHDLHHKNILEIGCGKGDFLVLLCQLGNNHGVGFDPTYVPLPVHEELGNHIQFIQDFYSEKYSNYQGDFIVCRHTLEHVQNPNTLLRSLRRVLGDRTDIPIFFEVPNGLDTFRRMAVWDIIYEHCCYFIAPSLAGAFTRNGFQVHDTQETFNGQFLCLEAYPAAEPAPLTEHYLKALAAVQTDLSQFAAKFQAKISAWEDTVSHIAAEGQRVVVWGAGSKGVTFLNLLQNQSFINYVVDINPRKQGKYIAGTGQQIVSPNFLRDYLPDVIIVMNSIYENEIQQMTAVLGLSPEFICV